MEVIRTHVGEMTIKLDREWKHHVLWMDDDKRDLREEAVAGASQQRWGERERQLLSSGGTDEMDLWFVVGLL